MNEMAEYMRGRRCPDAHVTTLAHLFEANVYYKSWRESMESLMKYQRASMDV